MSKKQKIKKIKSCRLCKSKKLQIVITLPNQSLTGVFPKSINEKITTGPLELVKCSKCSLMQLNHTYDLNEMYGNNYGYRTSLNLSMVKHVSKKILKLQKYLLPGDTVLDIGSNDGTLLKLYSTKNIKKIGIDPTCTKFKKYYPKSVKIIPKFFSFKNYNFKQNGKVKIITSLAMFYDLESPYDFAKDIEKILHDEGIWHFEQSYMPIMLKKNSYDTICHEHLEYYSLYVIIKILNKVGLKIHDVEINSVNGGSIAITVVKINSILKQKNTKKISYLLNQEKKNKLTFLKTYSEFSKRVEYSRDQLINFLKKIKKNNKVIIGYGASTKGNVILQYCNIGADLLPFIVEVNEEKYGKFTPGTKIPIISEKEAYKLKPDYYLILPWHFKQMIIRKEKKFINKGGKLVFPLPRLEIVGKNKKI